MRSIFLQRIPGIKKRINYYTIVRVTVFHGHNFNLFLNYHGKRKLNILSFYFQRFIEKFIIFCQFVIFCVKKFTLFLSYFLNGENKLQHNNTLDEIWVITHLLSKNEFNITASNNMIQYFHPVIFRKKQTVEDSYKHIDSCFAKVGDVPVKRV